MAFPTDGFVTIEAALSTAFSDGHHMMSFPGWAVMILVKEMR
jgi:hypothetical protein